LSLVVVGVALQAAILVSSGGQENVDMKDEKNAVSWQIESII
jgi:hypothetical protein